MPFIRCLNDYLMMRSPAIESKTTAYRVSRMDAAQTSDIKEGVTYRLGMYTATTWKKAAQADIEVWQQEHGAAAAATAKRRTYWEFEFPPGCYQATRIEQVSIHQHEHEILMTPYSAVYVKECVRLSPLRL